MFVLTVIIAVAVLAAAKLFSKSKNFVTYSSGIPGLGWFESTKQTLNLIWRVYKEGPDEFYGFVINIVRTFDSSFKFWLGPTLTVVIRDPEDVKVVLNSEDCSHKHFFYENFAPNGLVITSGPLYRQRKKAVQPAFYPSAIRSYIPIVNQRMKIFMERFEKIRPDEEFDIVDINWDYGSDVLLSCFYGLTEEDHDLRMKYTTALLDLIKHNHGKMIQFWMIGPLKFFSSAHRKFYRLYNKTLEHLYRWTSILEGNYQNKLSNLNQPTNFLSMLYKVRDSFKNFEGVTHDINVFAAAGFDTTGINISAVLLCLAMNEDIQDKVVAEQKEIFAYEDEEITEENMAKMEYLELVIKETMRMFPINPLYGRQATANVKLPNFTIPEGAGIVVTPLELHFSKKFWGENVHDFVPERFTRENFAKVHPYAYVPFSHGPRMCIGHRFAWITMKVYLSKFLRKYKVTTSYKYEDLHLQMNFTLHVKEGFRVTVEKRP